MCSNRHAYIIKTRNGWSLYFFIILYFKNYTQILLDFDTGLGSELSKVIPFQCWLACAKKKPKPFDTSGEEHTRYTKKL